MVIRTMKEKERSIDKATALNVLKNAENERDFATRELQIRTDLMSLEENNREIDPATGKCKFGTMQEYVDKQIELKKLQLEATTINLKDTIERADMTIKQAKEIIKNIELNVEPKGGK